MSISGDYPSPVTVNGYSCKNCTDVDYAKKHIDPAHPKDGPYGVDAKSDPKGTHGPAVTFSGQLAALASTLGPSAIAAAPPSPRRLDISA